MIQRNRPKQRSPLNERALRAEAEARACAELPHGIDRDSFQLYVSLLLKRRIREFKNEPEDVKQSELKILDKKLRELKDQARKRKAGAEKNDSKDESPAADFMAPAFNNLPEYTKGDGDGAVPVVTAEDVDHFIKNVERHAKAQNITLTFPILYDAMAKKFRITRETLNTPAMVHVKAAMLRERARFKTAAETPPKHVSESDALVFIESLKSLDGHLDIVEMISHAKNKFGITASNFKCKELRGLRKLLVREMFALGMKDVADAESSIEVLLS